MWDQITEMGLLGLPFEETLGGFGGGAVETAIVMEAFGRGLVLEPYFATVILGGGLLRQAASASVLGALAPKVAAGKLKLAFAHVERHSRYNLADVSTTAAQGRRWLHLDGAKSVVMHGDTADRICVTARLAGEQRAQDGIGLFLIDPATPGVARRGYPTQDGQRAAEVTLTNVRVAAGDLLNDEALPLIEHVIDEAIAALCAEAVGAMQSMHDLTLDYLKTRKQFGRPIGSFQVLQHRSVDMLVAVEQARSMALFAAVMAAEENPIERRKAISAAKVQIGRSGRHVGQEAIQLHGGIGMTNEYAVGHYFKRVTMIDQLYGDADTHLAYLAKHGGLFGEGRLTPPPAPAMNHGSARPRRHVVGFPARHRELLSPHAGRTGSRPGGGRRRHLGGRTADRRFDPHAAGEVWRRPGRPRPVGLSERYSTVGLYECSVFPGIPEMLEALTEAGRSCCASPPPSAATSPNASSIIRTCGATCRRSTAPCPAVAWTTRRTCWPRSSVSRAMTAPQRSWSVTVSTTSTPHRRTSCARSACSGATAVRRNCSRPAPMSLSRRRPRLPRCCSG